jgi:ubiquinone biosynthesis protein COQ9
MARRRRTRRDPAQPADAAARILHALLEEAEAVGWPAVRLHRIAEALGLSLSEVYRHYRDADAAAEAWLSLADEAMLAASAVSGFSRRPARDRLERTLLAWLDALARYPRAAREMLLGKLYPGHPHHVAALVFRLSRTVQWWREAAHLDAPPPRRQIEEMALTTLFVAAVARWASDRSAGHERTRLWVAASLRVADALATRLPSQDGKAAKARR